MDAKDGFLEKQIKYRPRIAQNLSEGVEVGCICKGWGRIARWGGNAKVR